MIWSTKKAVNKDYDTVLIPIEMRLYHVLKFLNDDSLRLRSIVLYL